MSVEKRCPCCERSFIAHGSRKYCDECKALTETQRTARIKKREKEKEEALKKKAEAKRDPFNPARMSDKRLSAVIAMFKMTYGTYTAAYRGGFIEQILKAKGFADPLKMISELEVY